MGVDTEKETDVAYFSIFGVVVERVFTPEIEYTYLIVSLSTLFSCDCDD